MIDFIIYLICALITGYNLKVWSEKYLPTIDSVSARGAIIACSYTFTAIPYINMVCAVVFTAAWAADAINKKSEKQLNKVL